MLAGLWVLLFLAVATYFARDGYGFQMRYVTALVPGAYAALFCHPRLADSSPLDSPSPSASGRSAAGRRRCPSSNAPCWPDFP